VDGKLEELEERYEAVGRELASPEVTSDHDRLRELGRTYAELGELIGPYREYRQAAAQAADARELAKREDDAELAAYFREEADRADALAAELRERLEELLVPRDPNEGRDVILEVRAGAGGQEAALWAGELFEMYRRLAERHRWKAEVLSVSESELGGLKEAALGLRGRDAYLRLKHESGVHRVQRVPVTESSGRIHTSTATVAVMPEADEVEIEIRPEDLEMDVFRGTGPGGQSVNTTDSAVRLTHKPTGMVVVSREERSQLQNREKALRLLRARLLAAAREEAAAKEAATRRSQVGTGERAEKIRTYNFPDGRVTDHRIKHTSHQLQDVLAGGEELDGFVEALLAAERAEQLSRAEG
jgi:peptide chain release factor 1